MMERCAIGAAVDALSAVTPGRDTTVQDGYATASKRKLGAIAGHCVIVARSSRASWSAVNCTRSEYPARRPALLAGRGVA